MLGRIRCRARKKPGAPGTETLGQGPCRVRAQEKPGLGHVSWEAALRYFRMRGGYRRMIMADSVEKQQFSEGSRPAHGRDAPAPLSQDPRIGEHRDHLMRLGFVWWSPPWRRRDRTRGIERSGLKYSRLAAPRRTQTRPSERYGRALAQSRCSPPRSSAPPTTTPIMPSGTRRGTGPTPAGSSRWKAGDEAAGIPSCQARAACFRAGVEGIALNAAYTSMIGALTSSPPSTSRSPLTRNGRGFLRRSGSLRPSRFGGFLLHGTA